MKKLLLPVAVVATLGFASCGGADVCDCVEMQDKMRDLDSKEDYDKFKEENKDVFEACDKMMEEAEKEGKEAMKALDEKADACDK